MAKRKIDKATGIPSRDLEIIRLMTFFTGKTYIPVLARTFFEGNEAGEQQAKNRITQIQKRYGTVRYTPTGLVKPRSAIVLTEAGKRLAEDMGLSSQYNPPSAVTVWHQILEQQTFFWLERAGKEVIRTYVRDWKGERGFSHTPDLAYYNDKDLVYIECETSKKRPDQYTEILLKASEKDKAKIILYVFSDEKEMIKIGKVIPDFEKVRYATLDQLIAHAKEGKVKGISQLEFRAKYRNKKVKNDE